MRSQGQILRAAGWRRGATLLTTVLLTVAAATIAVAAIQVALQVDNRESARAAAAEAQSAAHGQLRKAETDLGRSPLRFFDQVLTDEPPRVCVDGTVVTSGELWPDSCGLTWTYELDDVDRGVLIDPPARGGGQLTVTGFAEVDGQLAGVQTEYLPAGPAGPAIYSAGDLDLSVLGTDTVTGTVYADGYVSLSGVSLADGVALAAEDGFDSVPPDDGQLYAAGTGSGSGPAAFQPVEATGGTVTDIDVDGVTYRVHTFTSTGTFEVTDSGTDATVDYLVVAGGGGGGGAGASGGSGGGGGGVVRADGTVTTGSHSVTVGAGGGRGDGTGDIGFNGENSQFLGTTAIGGGGGEGGGTPSGESGGSGGGSRRDTNNRGGDFGVALQPGTNPDATLDAGHPGGIGPTSGGGGGGAGGPGGSGDGVGGPGVELDFDGTDRFYGAGGNGQFASETSGGQTTDQEVAAANVGAGGAGTYSTTRTGNVGHGGSGVVVVRYPLTGAAAPQDDEGVLDIRNLFPQQLPAGAVRSAIGQLLELPCGQLCLTAGAELADGQQLPDQVAGYLLLPDGDQLQVYTADESPLPPESLCESCSLTELDNLGELAGDAGFWGEPDATVALPADGIVRTDQDTMIGRCGPDNAAEGVTVCDTYPADTPFTVVVGTAEQPRDLLIGGPLDGAPVGGLASGALVVPYWADGAQDPVELDISVAAAGRPGVAAIRSWPASPPTDPRPGPAITGRLIAATPLTVHTPAFNQMPLTPASNVVRNPAPLLPAPTLTFEPQRHRSLGATGTRELLDGVLNLP